MPYLPISLLLTVLGLGLTQMANAQPNPRFGGKTDPCEAPQSYQAAYVYCANQEWKALGDRLDHFEASMSREPFRTGVMDLRLTNRDPKQTSRSLAGCNHHSQSRHHGSTDAVQAEQACITEWLNVRVDWTRKMQDLLKASPKAQSAIKEYEACKQSSDALLQAVCDVDLRLVSAHRGLAAAVEKLRAAPTSDAVGAMTRKHEQWTAAMIKQCTKGEQRVNVRPGCWATEFGDWTKEIESLVAEESSKAVYAAEQASKVERDCTVSWQGKQLRRFVVYYKSSNRLVLVEPPMNMAGPPMHRIATRYEGTAAAVPTGMLVDLGRPWLFSDDAQTQSLINGAGGGVSLNAGQLGRNIIEHNVRFRDASLTRGDYAYVATGQIELRAPLTCKAA